MYYSTPEKEEERRNGKRKRNNGESQLLYLKNLESL